MRASDQRVGDTMSEQTSGKPAESPYRGSVALILDSRGGYAHDAYRIAALLRHATAPAAVRILVPNKAKSAGTLLALGASELYMGQEAELGPLDVQIGEDALDPKHSALNEVQALERLRSVAIGQVIVY